MDTDTRFDKGWEADIGVGNAKVTVTVKVPDARTAVDKDLCRQFLQEMKKALRIIAMKTRQEVEIAKHGQEMVEWILPNAERTQVTSEIEQCIRDVARQTLEDCRGLICLVHDKLPVGELWIGIPKHDPIVTALESFAKASNSSPEDYCLRYGSTDVEAGDTFESLEASDGDCFQVLPAYNSSDSPSLEGSEKGPLEEKAQDLEMSSGERESTPEEVTDAGLGSGEDDGFCTAPSSPVQRAFDDDDFAAKFDMTIVVNTDDGTIRVMDDTERQRYWSTFDQRF